MAWEIINYSCGHTDRVQMYGKMSDRENKKGWMERSGDCPECYKASLAQIAKKQSEEAGLVDLQGSEKQVAWANKIRIDALKLTCNANPKAAIGEIARGNKDLFAGLDKADGEQILKSAESLVDSLKNQVSAKWWIDNRSDVDFYVVKNLKKHISNIIANTKSI